MRAPRIDQVSELTRGLRLPMPPIRSVHLDIIVDALKRALEQLVDEYGKALARKEEKELNSLLQARINRLCMEEKLLSQIVASVVRGGESISFDGKRLELRPDLGIHLTGRDRNFPLVIECKIIDEPNKKGVDLYCVNGIRRFVDGEYAWGSSQGLMLAYVRDGSSIGRTLTPHLRASAANNPDPFRTQAMPSKQGGLTLPVWKSCHGRGFSYVGATAGQPGPIGISHLWVNVPSAAAVRRKRNRVSVR